MKKCNRCRIVFHSDDRQRCLYCDTVLMTVDHDDTVDFREDKNFDANLFGGGIRRAPVLREILKDWQVGEYLRVQYMIGTYFKVRTFKFLYCFSRSSFKMGKGFKRALAQPLNLSSLLTIPWAIIDLVDSFMIRLMYNAHCEKCGWKFQQVHASQGHDTAECEYNQEYSRIVNDIVSGNITKSEGKVKQAAYKKILAGKRSAYRDLCLRRTTAGWFIDILCVWFSVCAVSAVIVLLSLPMIMNLIQKIGG